MKYVMWFLAGFNTHMLLADLPDFNYSAFVAIIVLLFVGVFD